MKDAANDLHVSLSGCRLKESRARKRSQATKRRRMASSKSNPFRSEAAAPTTSSPRAIP